jgi:hypothetical protein
MILCRRTLGGLKGSSTADKLVGELGLVLLGVGAVVDLVVLYIFKQAGRVSGQTRDSKASPQAGKCDARPGWRRCRGLRRRKKKKTVRGVDKKSRRVGGAY